MLKKRQGIILNTIDYKENHKILYLLTEAGKESFLVMRAKRIKEGLANDTQVLTLSPSPLAWRPDFPGAAREAH